jgi:two-component system response regulator FixJ
MTGAKGGRTVAVIDDDQSVRDAVESLLRSAGYQAEGFGSAEAFLSCPRRREFCCLVLDVSLPGISGLELQQRLLARGSRVPVVFVTATADPRGQTRRQALQLGAVEFLSKPFDELAMLNAVGAAVAP